MARTPKMTKLEATRRSADLGAFNKCVRGKHGGPHDYLTLLGMKSLETLELLKKVEAGLTYKAFERFQRNSDLQLEELATVVRITKRTLARRREQGRLTAIESDRLLRATRVFGMALVLFEGNVAAARHWLSTPAPALENRTPQDVSVTEVGAREVENLIGRLEHGVFS